MINNSMENKNVNNDESVDETVVQEEPKNKLS